MSVLHRYFCSSVTINGQNAWQSQLGVAQLVCLWATQYWKDDFQHCKPVRDELENFKKDVHNYVKDPLKCQQIEKLLSPPTVILGETNPSTQPPPPHKDFHFVNKQPYEMIEEEIRCRWPYLESIHLESLKIPDKLDILKYKASTLAEQLTLMDHFVFVTIQSRELMSQGWTKLNRWERSPHVLKMIGQFNSVSRWCQMTILTANNHKERKKILKCFISIAVVNINTLYIYKCVCNCHVFKKKKGHTNK
ncbi:Ras guanine nucleotide exchange factor [Reticulomyxa filosa]|uniref:Ras guanine nucleotide exchange factor n=1 Tax=Reticulomyxa filosa TaxID=46433 RepID=X6LXN1_RETFI|nr:Ras guanine nucleotide exchange factor [Reticulomyxa filosa]|eukprot:ETO05485.1 Ras guanine nucleotide exchange factor [Reticulomyxa filosa]